MTAVRGIARAAHELPRDVGEALLDGVFGRQWRARPVLRGHRELTCVLHRPDRHASLRVRDADLAWYCHVCGEGGGPVTLARRALGQAHARELLREIGRMGRAHGADVSPTPVPAPRIERRAPATVHVLGAPTAGQVETLLRDRRLREVGTLDTLGIRHLVVWGRDWLGIPLLAEGCWRVWAIDGEGRMRCDPRGKLVRLSVGPSSMLASPNLRDDATVQRLWDVAGESDAIAAIEAGMGDVIASTAGETSLAAHERHAAWLLGLLASEVVVVRDLDDAGRRGAAKAAQWWRSHRTRVRVLELPVELDHKGDLRDYLVGRAR